MEQTSSGRKWYSTNQWIWLAYCFFLWIEPILEPARHIALATLGVFLLFLPIYFTYIRTCNNVLRRWMVLLIVLLGALTFPWNTGGVTFMIYAAAFLPFCVLSTWRIVLFFFVELASLAAEILWVPWHGVHQSWYSVVFNGFLILMIGVGNIVYAQKERSERRMRRAEEEIEALAAVAERERIARDLHDVLGHTLSLIVLKSELAARLLTSETAFDPARAAVEIAEVERTARTALAEVREAIGGYRSRGLAAEIESARKTLAAAAVALHVEAADIAETRLSATEETVLALALREAVTNIVRHAQAHTCTLRFRNDRDGIRRLIVEDDGSHSSVTEGNGLRGMRERVEGLGGTLRLDRTRGTRLEVGLPPTPEAATA